MRFAKGHGTENDFIIVPDPDDLLELSAEQVRRLCDRRAGLGADGLLRVAPSEVPGTAWFMDYRNADGSIAEMCGNGIRVFARYLLDHGLAAGPELAIATRNGVRMVRQAGGGLLSADLGPAALNGKGTAVIGGRACAGVAISVGNPHLACVVTEPVSEFDLTEQPWYEPGQFPAGVNIELVRLLGGRIAQMRVYERGSGETRSCGTGAVAAAVAAAHAMGEWPAVRDPWTVQVPGGKLIVLPSPTASVLTGPAVIVAEGEADDAWLELKPPTLAGQRGAQRDAWRGSGTPLIEASSTWAR